MEQPTWYQSWYQEASDAYSKGDLEYFRQLCCDSEEVQDVWYPGFSEVLTLPESDQQHQIISMISKYPVISPPELEHWYSRFGVNSREV